MYSCINSVILFNVVLYNYFTGFSKELPKKDDSVASEKRLHDIFLYTLVFSVITIN